MSKILTVLLIVAVIAVIIILFYFMVYMPSSTNTIMDGAPCKVSGKIPGTVKNGICVPTVTEVNVSF